MDKIINPPIVSVIMPVFNCEKYISEAVESILNQTLSNLELIIIDDFSTDNSVDVVSKIIDKRIVFIKKLSKSGLVENLNLGIQLARGKYIARMDGDDISNKYRFERQVELLNNNPSVILCGTGYTLINDDKVIVLPSTHEEIKLSLLESCTIAHPTVMFRQSFLKQENIRYLNEFEGAEDYELWTRCIWKGKVVNLPDNLLSYRIHTEQFSTTNKINQTKLSNICRINMFKTVYSQASPTDLFSSVFLFQNEKINSIKILNYILSELKGIQDKNKNEKLYDVDKFEAYCAFKKRNIIRRFFLNQVSYTPKVLIKFFASSENYSKFLTKLEIVKFALKCLSFRH